MVSITEETGHCCHSVFPLERDCVTFRGLNCPSLSPCGWTAGLRAHTTEQERPSRFSCSLATEACNWSELQVQYVVWRTALGPVIVQ